MQQIPELNLLFDGLYFFLLQTPQYSGKVVKKKEKIAIPKRYALQVNATRSWWQLRRLRSKPKRNQNH